MNYQQSLLSPAAQKLYSALVNLERFNKNNDFFDNISSLDNFLSEYRNITFVIQKSLAHTEYFNHYKNLCSKFFSGILGKWLTSKRNEITKEQPFRLQKTIKFIIFNHLETLNITSKNFTIEEDLPFSSLIKDLRKFFNILIKESHFSVEFIFSEVGKSENIFDYILTSIETMNQFLSELNEIVKDESRIYKDTIKKINSLSILHLNKSDLFIDDYIYHSDTDCFEKGERLRFCIPQKPIPCKNWIDLFNPLKEIKSAFTLNHIEPIFLSLLIMHIRILRLQNNHLAPTIFIIYDNDTLTFESMDFSIRTTFYRKIYEVSQKIKTENIKTVIIIQQMWKYSDCSVLNMGFEERIKKCNPSCLLTGHYLNKNLKSQQFYFETESLDSFDYIMDILLKDEQLKQPALFMTPIAAAFKDKYHCL